MLLRYATRQFAAGCLIHSAKFTAAADSFTDNLNLVTEQHGVEGFEDGHKLIKSGLVDAILICTPHYFHPEYSIAGLKKGLHVLTEKPVAVTAKEAAKVEKVHAKNKKLVYAAMFQMRRVPLWLRVKKIIDDGQLGDLQRLNWIVTNWFRPQVYFDAGAWRATWKGEGGGVLLNQCPHNLDLIYWLLGMPRLVHAHVSLGKYHHIEVEDEVTAYLEWDPPRKGAPAATGVFVTSTGESPGTDRLEIAGDRGKIVVANGNVLFTQTAESVAGFSRTTEEAFGQPAMDTISIEVDTTDPGHRSVTENFIWAIAKPGTSLICSGQDAIHELELGNAMLMSGLTGKPVTLPMNRNAFDKMIKAMAADSKFKKGATRKAKVDMDKSFH